MIENSAGWRYVQSADTVADYPTVSEHNAGKFQDLKSTVDGKAPSSHTHSISQVTGLNAALAGKSPSSHTHSISQVTGLDVALAGKAPLPTLNTRVPENLALRLDTTVGTRIFAGNTMIHGDTGLRILQLKDAIPSATAGALLFRRVNASVTLQFIDFQISEPLSDLPGWVPAGFRPMQYIYSELISYYRSSRAPSRILGTVGTVQFRELSTENSYQMTYSYHTRDAWPATLLGLPG